MEIIPLSEGSFTIDSTKIFVPFDVDTDDLQSKPVGSLLVEIQPFIVKTNSDVILLDAGLGFEKNGQMQLHENMLNVNVYPQEVTIVLISHLHKDHIGGLFFSHNKAEAAFPNATYYLQKSELEYAIAKNNSSYNLSHFQALINHPQTVLLTDDEGRINENIRYKITGAHAPHHQVFWIEDNGQTVFFGGDDAPQLQQMKHRFVAKYDFDGKKAMELRSQWWKQGRQESWTFLFYHDVANSVFRQ